MRLKRKITSLLLALSLVAGLVPGLTVPAQAAGTDKTIMAGVSGISGPTKSYEDGKSGDDCYYAPSDYIWYGAYDQNSDGAAEPIQWRVLSTSGNATGKNDSLSDGTKTVSNDNALFLLSEYLLASGVYFQQDYHYDSDDSVYRKGRSHIDGTDEALANAWQGSDGQSWAKAFAGESGSSVTDAFSSGEQAALLETTKEEDSTRKYDITWGTSKLDGDKVFFLSADELSQYVGSYDYAPGLKATPAGSDSAGVWWLRSPYDHYSDDAGVVLGSGGVNRITVGFGRAVRPALNLNLTSVLFTSAAEGGKSSSFAQVTEYTDSGTKGWKVTLAESDKTIKDTEDSSGIKDAQGTAVTKLELTAGYSASQSLTVTHKSLLSISSDYTNITATLTNSSGEILYYGSINTDKNSTTSTVTIPLGLPVDTYTLSIRGEAWNGDKQTDYATEEAITAKITVNKTYAVSVVGSEAQNTGEGSYAEGATVSIDAGTKSGYTFAGWTSESSVSFADASSAQTTFKMPGDEVTVTANWTADSPSGGGGGTTTYSITLPDTTEGGEVTSSRRYAGKGDTVMLTVTPEDGYTLSSLTVKDSRGNELALTDRGEGKYSFTMPGSRVTVEAAFAKENPSTGGLPFIDVKAGDWFYDSVKHVYEQGLMVGTSATTFSPDTEITRGMIVTILWRQAGAPNMEDEIWGYPYADVDAEAYYGTAVYWARLNGIASGYGNNEFGPDDPITREQLAVILWRYAGSPAASGSLAGYTDAGSVSGYAVDALRWAVSAGIIQGTSSATLSPQGTATRAQAAAMLQRYLERIGG